MEKRLFTIRVYALIINEKNEILISDEYVHAMEMTKFPGGGLEYGEGTVECLQREAIEEFGQEIEVLDHFYTTDFFQRNFFHPDRQLISIYYFAQFTEPVKFTIANHPFDFSEIKNGAIAFRWLPLSKISPAVFTFAIDKKVAELLQIYNNNTLKT